MADFLDMVSAFLSAQKAFVGLFILAGMFVGFIHERFPATVIAVLGICAFLATGILDSSTFLNALANPAPVTIAAMFILSAALTRTGTLDVVGSWIVARARQRPVLATVELVLGLFCGAAFMNNTPVVIIMIPIVIRLAAAINVSARKFLIPLSYLSMLSGTLTLVGTSTNLLADAVATDLGLTPFGIFEITPIGIGVAIAGVVTLLILGPFLLPDGDIDHQQATDDRVFLTEIRIPKDSEYIGSYISDIGVLKRLNIAGLNRVGQVADVQGHILSAGDKLIARATLSEIMTLRKRPELELGTTMLGSVPSDSLQLVEATIAPSHPSIGRRTKEIPFLNMNPIRLLGITRHGHLPGPTLGDSRIRAADTVLVTGTPDGLRTLEDNPNLIGVGEAEEEAFRPTKAPVAIGALAGAVLLSALGVLPIMIAALFGVAVVLATRCIDAEEAWRSMNGDVLILIFGMLVVGAALNAAGSIELLIGWFSPYLQNLSPVALLFVIYFTAGVLTEAISNNAVAVIMTPIAIGLGADLGVDPRPLVIAVMFAASASFATPISYQTNTMVYAAGNYRFADFLRIGLPMNVVVGTTTCLLLWYYYY